MSRHPGVEDLSLPHEIVEGPHDLFDRGDLVPDVQPVQIDVVGSQPLQAGFHRPHHALAVVAGGVGVVAGSGVGVLGRQDDAVPVVRHELAQKLFAGAVRVVVGGVDEVAARLEEGVVDLAALFLRGTPAPSSPKVIVPRHSSDTRRPLLPSSL